MQLTQQQLLQQAMSGQITLPPGMSREAVGGFLMKAGLNPNQIQNSQSILNKVRYIFLYVCIKLNYVKQCCARAVVVFFVATFLQSSKLY